MVHACPQKINHGSISNNNNNKFAFYFYFFWGTYACEIVSLVSSCICFEIHLWSPIFQFKDKDSLNFGCLDFGL